jgi:glycosyltransferase involved in cell wall biosynthesis
MTSEVYYPNLPGGLLRFFRYGPGMRERGVQFHMHTKREPDHDEAELEINGILITRHELPDGISHHEERERLVELAFDDLSTRRATEAVCLQPNGVTLQSARTLRNVGRQDTPLVMSFSMFPDDPPSGFLRRIRHRLGLKALVAPFDRFITCSKRMKAAFHDVAGIPNAKIEVLRNGVDLDRYAPAVDDSEKAAIRARLDLPAEAPTLLYSGSITRRKGTDLLLDAWPRVLAEFPDAKLLLAGSLGRRKSFRDPAMRADLDAFTEEFDAKIAALPERDSVVLLGEVDAVDDYYRASDLFVFPSHLEGLPNSVLEAMACRLPCVVSPFKGIPLDGEEFGHAGEQFVKTTHEPTQIAADTIALLSDEERRRAMGAAARKWMEDNQSLDATLDQLAELYRKLATPPRR